MPFRKRSLSVCQLNSIEPSPVAPLLDLWCTSIPDHTALYCRSVLSVSARIMVTQLPTLEEIYTTRCLRKATSICGDPTHSFHRQLELLPSGRCYKCLHSHTTRLKIFFYPSGGCSKAGQETLTHNLTNSL